MRRGTVYDYEAIPTEAQSRQTVMCIYAMLWAIDEVIISSHMISCHMANIGMPCELCQLLFREQLLHN